jgi:hypothetical protein
VARAINYYQRGGWGLALVPESFRGKLVNNDLAADVTITHFNIDDDSRIHADVLREVDAVRQVNMQVIPLPRSRRR